MSSSSYQFHHILIPVREKQPLYYATSGPLHFRGTRRGWRTKLLKAATLCRERGHDTCRRTRRKQLKWTLNRGRRALSTPQQTLE
jgi:hypothetical protein